MELREDSLEEEEKGALGLDSFDSSSTFAHFAVRACISHCLSRIYLLLLKMWYLKLIFMVLSTVVIVALFTSQGLFIQKHSHHHFARFSHFSDKETENLERRNHTAAQRQSLAPYSRLFQGHLFCLHLQQSVNGGRVQVEWRPGTPQAGAQKRQRLAMSPRAPR